MIKTRRKESMILSNFFKKNKIVIILGAILLCIALFSRISVYLEYDSTFFSSLHYFEALGSGGDADYQVKNAIYSIQGHASIETFLHYDYLFLIPYLTFFIKTFGFLNGLQLLMYFTVLLGSITPIIIFLLLSRRKKYSMGGFFVGLLLALNPLLIEVSAGRFILDTNVMFLFSLFLTAYVLAIETKTTKWVIALGTLTLIQDLNKPFLLINDMPLLAVFTVLFLLKEYRLKKHFPFFHILFSITKKRVILSILPIMILLAGYVSFEVFEFRTFHKHYFLGEMLFNKSDTSTGNYVLRDSLASAKSLSEKIKNISAFSLIAIQELLDYAAIPFIFLIGAVCTGLYGKRRYLKQLIFAGIILLVLSIFFFTLTTRFLLPFSYMPKPSEWQWGNFFSFALFFLIIGILMTRSIKYFSFGIMQLLYLFAVGMTISTAIAPRHFDTLVIWFAFCVGILLDTYISDLLLRMQKRIFYIVLFIIAIPFSAQLFTTAKSLVINIHHMQNNKVYYSWIKTVVTPDDYILGGSGENLMTLSKITQRTVLYNSLFTPLIIRPGAKLSQLENYGSVENKPINYADFISSHATGNEKNGRLFVLDDNVHQWIYILSTDSKAEFPKNKYMIREYVRNNTLHRLVYILTFR